MQNPDTLDFDDTPALVTGYEVWAEEKRSISRGKSLGTSRTLNNCGDASEMLTRPYAPLAKW